MKSLKRKLIILAGSIFSLMMFISVLALPASACSSCGGGFGWGGNCGFNRCNNFRCFDRDRDFGFNRHFINRGWNNWYW